MKRSPVLAGILSFVIPGLGQIYAKETLRSAAVLLAVIIVGNLNAIFLAVFANADLDPTVFWASRLPRLLHDVAAFYGVVFWIWQTVDAVFIAKKMQRAPARSA